MENNAAASGDKVTPVEIVKVCKMHGELGRGDVYVNKLKHQKFSYRCKICFRAVQRNWNKHAEKAKEGRKKRYIKNREAIDEYNKKNKEKWQPLRDMRSRMSRETLSDVYIKRLLISRSKVLRSADISPQVVSFKRTALLIKRSIRNG